MKVYVACSNKVPIVEKEGYHNIEMGAKKSDTHNFEYRDDVKKNISEKNPYYCELTGLYWMTKNSKDKIIGLNHYRRFFYGHVFITNKKNAISEKQVEKILKNYDVIVPQLGYLFRKTVYQQYEESHNIDDLKKVEKIIKKKYPDYYPAYEKIMNSNCYYPFNMFIGKKEVIDDYSEWLFSILEDLDKMVDFSKRVDKSRRTPGFLGERLFNVWLLKNNIKVKQKPVYNTEKSMIKQELAAFIKLFMP